MGEDEFKAVEVVDACNNVAGLSLVDRSDRITVPHITNAAYHRQPPAELNGSRFPLPSLDSDGDEGGLEGTTWWA